MRRAIALLLVMNIIPVGNAFALGDSIPITMAIKAQTAMDEARGKLLQLEVVKNTKFMYDNYIQTKKYYDEIKAASQNRGGLFGYYRDKFMDRFNEAKYEELRAIQKLKDGDENNQVKKWAEQGEAWVDSKIDNSADKMIEQMKKELDAMRKLMESEDEKAKMRETITKQLSIDASRGGLTDKQRDSIMMQIEMTHLEYAASADRYNRMDFATRLSDLTRQLQAWQRNQVASSMYRLNVREKRNDRMGKEITRTEILRELQKLPNAGRAEDVHVR